MRRAAAVALLALALGACGCGDAGSAAAGSDTARFLGRFVDPDGRVVRHDQGGDTVSEGQAYALLVAASTGDRHRFQQVWSWSRRNLRRSDGLFAWHWRGGRVVDRQPAADADIDMAHALALGAQRFRKPALARSARRIGRAVLAHETVRTPAGPAIAAGPWARPGRIVNPSYVAPRAFQALFQLSDGARWHAAASAGRRMIASLTGRRRLPPDWAVLSASGRARPSAPPGRHARPIYSWDAARVPIRFAASCSPADQKLAGALWPLLRRRPALLPRGLGGAPVRGAVRSSVGLAAAAASAWAAGHPGTATRLLGAASQLERSHPTYFGSALVALTRTMVMGGRAGCA